MSYESPVLQPREVRRRIVPGVHKTSTSRVLVTIHAVDDKAIANFTPEFLPSNATSVAINLGAGPEQWHCVASDLYELSWLFKEMADILRGKP